MDYYTNAAGRETLNISESQALRLMKVCPAPSSELPELGSHIELQIVNDLHGPEEQDSNFRLELTRGRDGTFALHIYADENLDMDGIGDEFLDVIGGILTELKQPWWEVGVSESASRHAPGSFGGGKFRFLCDGSLVWAQEIWSIEVLKMYAKMAAAE